MNALRKLMYRPKVPVMVIATSSPRTPVTVRWQLITWSGVTSQ